ncbi:MAG TPA: hypothetical protein VLW52_13055 [Opitutaceae bacterium]|nr:hypothetical protein [Opitutaceae bacterium]
MKTLFSLLSILALLTATESLDASQWDAGALFSAIAVAVLFAIALNDARRPERSLVVGRVERYQPQARISGARRAHSLDLAA